MKTVEIKLTAEYSEWMEIAVNYVNETFRTFAKADMNGIKNCFERMVNISTRQNNYYYNFLRSIK